MVLNSMGKPFENELLTMVMGEFSFGGQMNMLFYWHLQITLEYNSWKHNQIGNGKKTTCHGAHFSVILILRKKRHYRFYTFNPCHLS